MPQERRSHKEKERRKDKERHERDKASSCGFAECSMLVVLSTTFDWQREMHTVCGRARSVTPRPCRNWSESSRRKRRRSNIALQGMHPGMKPGALRCVLSFFFSLSLSLPHSFCPLLRKGSMRFGTYYIHDLIHMYIHNIYMYWYFKIFFFCDLCRLRIIRPYTRWEHRVLHMQALALVQQHYLHFTSWEAIPIYPHPADHYRPPAA